MLVSHVKLAICTLSLRSKFHGNDESRPRDVTIRNTIYESRTHKVNKYSSEFLRSKSAHRSVLSVLVKGRNAPIDEFAFREGTARIIGGVYERRGGSPIESRPLSQAKEAKLPCFPLASNHQDLLVYLSNGSNHK